MRTRRWVECSFFALKKVYRVGLLSVMGFLQEHLSSAHARVARAERAGHRALARAHLEFQLRLEKTHALLSNRCRRAPAGRVGHRPPRMDTWGYGCAVSNHACCTCAGMLVRPHGTRLHLTRVFTCSQVTQPTQCRLLHAVRHRRQRGAGAALPVSPVGRTGGCCCCGMRP